MWSRDLSVSPGHQQVVGTLCADAAGGAAPRQLEDFVLILLPIRVTGGAHLTLFQAEYVRSCQKAALPQLSRQTISPGDPHARNFPAD
jgi:hypothetical protein